MMRWSRAHTFIAGAALILAANAVALLGVAHNRSGEADSRLRLTQRELHLPYGGGLEGESSGIALTLHWRSPAEEAADPRVLPMPYQEQGAPAWLDKGKLAELGFDVSRPVVMDRGRMHYGKQLAREALLVLELDGPAFQQALERARQHAADLEALDPGSKGFGRVGDARVLLEREERMSSRLFLVDAGLDAAALRAKYPDRARYAIVRGRVRPWVIGDKAKPRLSGRVTLNVDQINVPHAFRPVFEPLLRGAHNRSWRDAQPPFEVAVAFGQRFEPWITAASGKTVVE